MTYIQYTDFKNHTKGYFDKIAEGEELIIIRHGIPVARVLPFESKTQGWKRDIQKINPRKNGKSLDQIIREERDLS